MNLAFMMKDIFIKISKNILKKVRPTIERKANFKFASQYCISYKLKSTEFPKSFIKKLKKRAIILLPD